MPLHPIQERRMQYEGKWEHTLPACPLRHPAGKIRRTAAGFEEWGHPPPSPCVRQDAGRGTLEACAPVFLSASERARDFTASSHSTPHSAIAKRAGGTDAAKLRDALAATKDFKGITGVITIDEKRNASKSAVIMTIENAAMKFMQTVAP